MVDENNKNPNNGNKETPILHENAKKPKRSSSSSS